MKSWTIAKKLTTSMAILIALSISILAVFAYQLKGQTTLTQVNNQSIIDVGNTLNFIQRARLNLRDALFATQSNAPEERILYYKNTYQKLAQQVDELVEKMSKQPLSPTAKQFLNEGISGWVDLKTVVGKIEKATNERNFDQAIHLMLTDCYKSASKSVSGFNQFADQLNTEIKSASEANIESINSFTLTASIIAILAIALASTLVLRTISHMRKSLDGPVGDEILKSCESAGFIGLAFYDSGARSLYSKKPIKTVADVKGLKVRVQQSELWVALIGAMGGNATPMPFGEVYTGLKTGLIDAAENNIPSFDTAKHVEAVKIYSKTEHSMAPEILVMSKVVYDKLPKAEQDMIRQAARASVAVQRRAWDDQEAKSLANVKKLGADIVEVDKASFQAVMGPVYDKFMTTPDLKRLVKSIQDTK